MDEKKYCLAIDIGASSGRHIVGFLSNGILETVETYRFPNFVEEKGGQLVWDTERLFSEIKTGIKQSFLRFPKIESLAIDTWGVDYVLIDDAGKEILPCVSYRDKESEAFVQAVHDLIPFEKLYEKTGTQFQPFNTIYKLFADREKGKIDKAKAFLMMPEYFSYRLTGVMKKEYTNASTTGLVRAETGKFDEEIVDKLGLAKRLFGNLCMPGETVGELKEEIAAEVGGQTKVVFCPSHDTASAFEAVTSGKGTAVLSSGTWSLFGAKLSSPVLTPDARKANFTNEGGVGYIRFLKNIMGLWLIGELKKEFGCDFGQMVEEGRKSGYDEIFDVNDRAFLAPKKMSEAIKEYFTRQARPTPQGRADLFRTVYRSLANSYARATEELERITGEKIENICIIGGGAKNDFLNELTEEFTHKKVIALPIEGTAIGNLRCQMTKGETHV